MNWHHEEPDASTLGCFYVYNPDYPYFGRILPRFDFGNIYYLKSMGTKSNGITLNNGRFFPQINQGLCCTENDWWFGPIQFPTEDGKDGWSSTPPDKAHIGCFAIHAVGFNFSFGRVGYNRHKMLSLVPRHGRSKSLMTLHGGLWYILPPFKEESGE